MNRPALNLPLDGISDTTYTAGTSRRQAADRVRIVELLEPSRVIRDIESAVAQHVVCWWRYVHHAALLAVVGHPTGTHLRAHEEHRRELPVESFGRDPVVEVALGVVDPLLAELHVSLVILVLDDPEDHASGDDEHGYEGHDHLPRLEALVANHEVTGARVVVVVVLQEILVEDFLRCDNGRHELPFLTVPLLELQTICNELILQ